MTISLSLTVIVPYFNEADNLSYVLEGLRAQTRQPDRVVLVDSSSTDIGPSIVDEWISVNAESERFVNFRAQTTTPGGTKSAGLLQTTTDLVAFMDCGLSFPRDWLERQVALLQSRDYDWVSGVCKTSGVSLVDKAAIAHTYGFLSSSPVIPGSVMRRSVFDKVGLFRNLRAGYDVEWARAADRCGLTRGINPEVVVQYRGVNFASDIRGVFQKSIRYARPSVARTDTRMPWVYMAAGILAGIITIVSPTSALLGLLAYLVARVLLAWSRSASISYFLTRPNRLLTLCVVGAVMDAGKFLGFANGLYLRYVRRKIFTH